MIYYIKQKQEEARQQVKEVMSYVSPRSQTEYLHDTWQINLYTLIATTIQDTLAKVAEANGEYMETEPTVPYEEACLADGYNTHHAQITKVLKELGYDS